MCHVFCLQSQSRRKKEPLLCEWIHCIIARIMWFEHVSCWSFSQIWLIIGQKKREHATATPIYYDVYICTILGALLMKDIHLAAYFLYVKLWEKRIEEKRRDCCLKLCTVETSMSCVFMSALFNMKIIGSGLL